MTTRTMLCGVLAAATLLGACTTTTSGHPASPSGSATPPGAPASAVTPDMADAMAAARRAFGAVASYDYRHLDADYADAIRYLAEPFRSQYRRFWTKTVKPRATSHQYINTTHVTDTGVSAAGSDTISVLAFAVQRASSKGQPVAPSQIAVHSTMKRMGNQWLLSQLDILGTGAHASMSTSWASPDLAAALVAGRDCVTRLGTLDQTRFDAEFQAMLDCTTGDLRDQVAGQHNQLRDAAAEASAVATVRDLALVDARADRVTLLLAQGSTTTQRSTGAHNRLLHDLVVMVNRVGARWLASDVTNA